ncbi:MAG: hypothetical protein IT337_18435 [Thermomicrobiales bacterium]|nr:hypothetical protein [Thermomicrobiales bacterium]
MVRSSTFFDAAPVTSHLGQDRSRPTSGASPSCSFRYYKWYAGLAVFSELGVARLEGVTA